MKFKILTCAGIAGLLGAQSSVATVPDGYYDACEGKSGQALLMALWQTISSHTDIGYSALFDLYKRSDVRPEDGSIWDMYSTKHWDPSEKCGNYSSIGSCFNREHSFPKNWFGGAVAPMYSDAYHLYPTDGQVNNYRGNLPYGECSGGQTWSNGSIKALGRRGASTFAGYNGTVFEPDDEYKGDFARSYFYMAACYNDRIDDWSSDMLAGNSYPAFSSWAVEMLMKWHRQDQVSDKETTRNEVVSEVQHNRNPFIDYPDLAEHIWGSKVSEPWHSSSGTSPKIMSPADGSIINLGLATLNSAITTTLTVSGFGLDANVNASCSGEGFSVSPATLTPEAVNNGSAQLTVSFSSASAMQASGTLTLRSGDISSIIRLEAEAMAGIPVYDAEQLTESSFVIRWVNIDGPDARYKINVSHNGQSIKGYPVEVAAADGRLEIAGLDPETTYVFSVASGSTTSRTVEVTTPAASPLIQLMFDAELSFVSRAGTPSDPAEILAYIENIGSNDVVITVSEPFELSDNRTDWATSITLAPDADRFYMRLNSNVAGRFVTAIEARAGSYVNDDAEVEGIVTSADFVETFENESELSSYDGGTYVGIATTWMVEAGNIWEADNSFNDTQSMRFNAKGMLTMAEPKAGGVGSISFDIRKWNNNSDKTAVVVAEYSTDGGLSWNTAGEASSATPEFTTHQFTVNQTGNVLVRLRQTAGKRFNLDNVKITDWAGTNQAATLTYHSWDAYSPAPGRLTIAVADDTAPSLPVVVYDVDGRTRHVATATAGQQSNINLPAGLYIVVADDFSRRVVVR